MPKMSRFALIAAPALILAGCSQQPAEEPAASAPAGTEAPAAPQVADASAPPASFAVCKTCHAIEPGKSGVGPSMAGIFGRKAGTVEGYSYSPALAASGLTWDRATLDKWLEAPMKLVPGTKMVQATPDAAKRKEIIDYLETLK